MLKISLTLITTAALGLAATAQADLTWDWSFTPSGPGNFPVSGQGTLTTGPLSGTGTYAITGITGTYTRSTGTYSILSLETSLSINPPPDNTLYTPGSNGTKDGNQLSFKGLSFDVGPAGGPAVGAVNITDEGDPNTYLGIDTGIEGSYGLFTATPVAAPEPSQVASMLTLAGVGGAGLLLNLRRRR